MQTTPVDQWELPFLVSHGSSSQITDFEQTDTETPLVAALTGTIGNRGVDVTP